MAVIVKVFGRRPDTVPNKRQARWPASENLQRRKPREKVRAVPRSDGSVRVSLDQDDLLANSGEQGAVTTLAGLRTPVTPGVAELPR